MNLTLPAGSHPAFARCGSADPDWRVAIGGTADHSINATNKNRVFMLKPRMPHVPVAADVSGPALLLIRQASPVVNGQWPRSRPASASVGIECMPHRMVMRTLLILAMLTGAAAFASAQTLKALPPPSDVKAAPADAKKTKSGLAYKVITPGKGKRHPNAQNQVTVHYTGWTTDGKMFDSSV